MATTVVYTIVEFWLLRVITGSDIKSGDEGIWSGLFAGVHLIQETLDCWAPLTVLDSLRLLRTDFPCSQIRNHAVHNLKSISSDEMCDYLPQLVQVLRLYNLYVTEILHHHCWPVISCQALLAAEYHAACENTSLSAFAVVSMFAILSCVLYISMAMTRRCCVACICVFMRCLPGF